MASLVDTCVLLRAFETGSPQLRPIRRALARLLEDGEPLFVSVQNIAEFWNVATRPLANNGQGLSPERAERRIKLIERFCEVISEDLHAYDVWKTIVVKLNVIGVAVHDARLVATMIANRIDRIVTLNEGDFRRYQREGIVVATPERISRGS